jgi:NIMA-interacting peptidyl-prolyl cis-trans isomerase 1
MIKKFRIKIVNKEIDLGTLAETESDCSSAKRKGDLNTFSKGNLYTFDQGQMQVPFENAAFALEVNELSEPVETDSGLHLILRFPQVLIVRTA